MLLIAQETIHIAVRTLMRLHPVAQGLRVVNRHAAGCLAMLGAGGVAGTAVHRHRVAERHLAQEGRLRRETTAYLALDLSAHSMDRGQLARLLSQIITARSSFSRAALLLRDSAGALSVAGSVGVDDLSIAALNRWGAQVAPARGLAPRRVDEAVEVAVTTKFQLQLERRLSTRASDPMTALGCSRMYLIPISSARGMLGAIAVCIEPQAMRDGAEGGEPWRMLEPIEALALRLGAQLARAPKVAGVRAVQPMPERVRVRGRRGTHVPGQVDHSSGSSLHRTTAEIAQQVRDLMAPEKALNLHRPVGVLQGFPSARLWHQPPLETGQDRH